MSLTAQSEANYLFKKLNGVSSTSDAKQFFEEPRAARQAIFLSQVLGQSDLIPTTAPTLADQATSGVVKFWSQLTLTAVPGVANAFYSDNLKGCIPFNFGDGSYNYVLKDSAGNAIPFGQGDWIVDPDTGTLTFYTSTPANMPPKISFYQYVGTYGAVGANPPYLTLQQQTTAPGTPPSGFQRIYMMTDGKAYTIDSGGTIKKLGSGGGGGTGKNYLGDLYDGSAVTGIAQFAQGANYSFNSSSNYVDTLGYAINYLGGGLFFTGQPVVYSAGTTAIAGLVNGTTYYAVRISSTTFGLASTQFNANAKVLLPLTSQGVGTQGFAFQNQFGLATGGIVTGLTTSVNTASSPLRSGGNQRLSKDAANRQGMGWSYDFTPDPADTDGVKPMKVAFKLRTSSAFVTGDVVVSLLDLTNNVLVPLDGQFNVPLTAATLTTGYQSIFYPPAASTSYRLAITIATTNASAYTLDLIDWDLEQVGGSAPGAIMTPWQNHATPVTVTALTTNPTKPTTAVEICRSRRVGQNLEFDYQISWTGATGVSGSGAYLWNPFTNNPLGSLQIDSALLPSSTTTQHVCGEMRAADSANTAIGEVFPASTTSLILYAKWSTGNGLSQVTDAAIGSAGYSFANNNGTTTISFKGSVPISGWSAGAQFSTNDQALKNVPYFTKSGDAVPTASGTYPAFTNNSLTLPPGIYDLTGYVQFTFGSGNPLWNQCNAQFGLVNGNNTATVPTAIETAPDITVYGNSSTNVYMNSQVNFWTANVACTVKLSVTRTIYLNAYQVAGAATGGKITAYFTANKRPDFSAFSVVTDPAPATMFQGYVGTATAMTATTTNLPLTSLKDTDFGWNGTSYTVQRDGDYLFGGTLVTSTVTHNLLAYVNNVFKQYVGVCINPTAGQTRFSLSGTITGLKKNDVITLRSDNNVTVQAFAGDYVTITRVTAPNYTGVYGNVDIRSVTSSVFTGSTSALWLAMSNNSITLPVGTWRVKNSAWFYNNGTIANYNAAISALCAANGANTATQPAAPGTLSNVVVLSANATYLGGTSPTNAFDIATPPQEWLLQVTSGSATLYSNAYFQATTPANARITTYITAERLQ